MDYQLVFSPRLELAPATFVSTWNAEPAMREVAQAQLTSTSQATYNPLLDIVSLVVSTVGLGLGTNALYDLIKKVCTQKDHAKHIKITRLDQPDGTHLLTIDIDE